MAPPHLKIAHQNDYDMLTVPQISIPSRKQSGVVDTRASADLIRRC